MIPLAAKVSLCCVGAACVVKKKKRPRPQPAPCPPAPEPCYGQTCPAMPWLDAEVTEYMVSAWRAGERDAHALGVGALQTVYPTGPDGQALKWPTAREDCDEKKVLESRVMLRAERLVAEARDIEADSMWFESGGY